MVQRYAYFNGCLLYTSGLFLARVELVEIFMVGTNVPNGVPRPVVKSTCLLYTSGGILADKFGYGKMVTTGIVIMFAGYVLLAKMCIRDR